MDAVYKVISRDLLFLKCCYLYYDEKKWKWIYIVKTSGDGVNAYFCGQGGEHEEDASYLDEMQKHPLYAKYPVCCYMSWRRDRYKLARNPLNLKASYQ